ncbi:helix-turn-helix domain-containing protein [Actinomadura sp. 9N215]|uniref:nSTAND1 domain-containing NTPase n=1 Tax=Actinomadura sp. 9N215 TaxID=3375150 RepID=UPI00378916D8
MDLVGGEGAPQAETSADGAETTFGAELRRLRQEAGKSQADLAGKLRTNKGYLSRLERGLQRPSEAFARALDDALGAGGALFTLAVGPATGTCPYPGLTSFREQDAPWFFGRDRAVADLLGLLADPGTAGHPAVVVGPSGIGKSSLLRAGLAAAVARGALPARQPGTPETLYLTPTARPVEELRGREARRRLESYALVVVDQFEELFTLCGDQAEREAFIEEVCGSAADGVPVVLGVRADFYGHCLAHPGLLDALRKRALPLGPMTVPQLRQAITEPALAEGLSLEPGLVEVLLRDLGAAPGAELCAAGALPLLSHALRATWQHRADGVLTVAGYERTGGIHGAIAASAERVYAQLSPQEQDAARAVILRMVRVGDHGDDVRQPAGRDALVAADPAAERVVEAFTRARLLTADAGHVEISHEALLGAWPRLRAWIDDGRTALRTRQQLAAAARAWRQEGGDPHLLYRGARLAAAQDLTVEHRVSQEEQDFIRASQERQEAEARAERLRSRRLRRLTAALAVLTVLVACVAAVAVHQSSRARHQTAQANAAALAAAAAEARAQGRNETADLLAAAAYRLDPGAVQARSALLSTQGDLLTRRLPSPPRSVRRLGQALSPGGRTLATYDEANRVQLWDLPAGMLRRELATGPETIAPQAVTVSTDGHTVAVGKGSAKRVWVWSDGTPRTFEMPDAVTCVALSPDGKALAVAGDSTSVRIIDARTGQPLTTLTGGHRGAVQGLVYSPDGRQIATAGKDGVIAVWDAHNPDEPRRRHAVRDGNLLSATFSSDGRYLAAVGHDRLALLWDLRENHAKTLTTPVTGSALRSAAFSPDNRILVTAGDELRLSLWSVATRGPLVPLVGHTAPVHGVGFTGQGRTLLSTAEDGTTAQWDLTRAMVPGAAGQFHEAVTFLRGGVSIVASDNRTVRLWDTTTHAYQGAFEGHTGGVYRLATDASGQVLATAGWDGSVRLWDPATRRQRELLLDHTTGVCGLAVSPTGKIITAGDSGGTLHIWNRGIDGRYRTVKLRGEGADAAPCALAISHDERWLAFGNDVGQIHLLDLTSSTPPKPIGRHHDSVRSVAFTRDGTTLASASDDHEARVWNLDKGTHQLLTRFAAEARSVAFNTDGTLLAASASDGTIRLWDSRTYQPFATLTGHHDKVDSITFHPTKPLLASAGVDGTVRLWDLDPGRVREHACTRALPRNAEEWKNYAPHIPPPKTCA